MGEAAVREPSMEDILSSIRKIISEEGAETAAPAKQAETSADLSVQQPEQPAMDAAPQSHDEPVQMLDVLEQVRTSDTNFSEQPSVSDTPSGDEAARMANALAAMSVTEPAPAQESVWEDAPQQNTIVDEQPVVASESEVSPSLSDIAQSVVDQPEVAEFKEPFVEPSAIVEQEAVETYAPEQPQVRHVEMADAMPAPATESLSATNETSLEQTAQAVVEEEMAFRGALMSPSADGAVSGAFDRLKRSAMDDMDAKTEAILRPMLREWLDENLPKMVERLVREEIERVARGV